MNNDQKIELSEKLYKYVKEYKNLLKLYIKQKNKRDEVMNNPQYTRSQYGIARDSMQCTSEAILRIEHEIHCLCVELELAAKEDWRYEDVKVYAHGQQHGALIQGRRTPKVPQQS